MENRKTMECLHGKAINRGASKDSTPSPPPPLHAQRSMHGIRALRCERDNSQTEGLVVKTASDSNDYASGKKVSGGELSLDNVQLHKFRSDWNYTIRPNAD